MRALGTRVRHAELLHPEHPTLGGYRRLALPLPGDPTQRLMPPRWRAIARHVERLSPDAIVVPTPGPYGLAGLALARRLGTPLVVGYHTDDEALARLYRRGPFGRLCSGCLNRANRLLFRHASRVLANAPETALQALACGARDVELMGTSIASAFRDTPIVPPRERLERVLFAGRLAEEKNLPAVIRLAEARPALEVVVAGDGPLRGTLERAAARLPNLRATGRVSRERLVGLIDASDAFVLPSLVESFGTVALEAMSRARPVIVSTGCGIADWFSLSDALVAAAPEETLEASVDRLAALAPAGRRALGERARQASRQMDDDNASAWVARLEELARTRGRTAHPAGESGERTPSTSRSSCSRHPVQLR